ncbi:MAG: sulfotransferase [Chloroflexi bacterium]|nr:sulfotransferase [Chloroflexota bacterium]
MLKQLFGKTNSKKSETKTIVVVSGLPRSGTSMMMKMLAEGGLETVTDSIRSADEDNPNGYFEFETVKQMANGQTQWLSNADHKVVKIISALLEYLPENYHYKILFMEREIGEILASQRKMLARRNEESKTSDAEMASQFREHLAAIKFWIARQPNIEVLYVDYNKMLSNPDEYCQNIAEFIGLPVDVEKMRSVPDEHLYRNRSSTRNSSSA